MTCKVTPSYVLFSQHCNILQAISLLQHDANEMTDTINPGKADWQDVSKFAQTADLARSIIQHYEETKGLNR